MTATQPAIYPYYLEGGTPNTVGIAGLGAGVDYVVEQGVASERMITTGLQNSTSVEVKMGLLKGESIVNSGFETLRDQSRVRILR